MAVRAAQQKFSNPNLKLPRSHRLLLFITEAGQPSSLNCKGDNDMATTTDPAGLQRQRDYINKLEASGFDWDLLVGDAFVRGMRDIGYKSTAFALGELIDNAVQATATKVDVAFGFNGGSTPTSIAVIDNGHGMEPKMVRASLIWGAGTRENDRSGFGKYGYGLPSASVSQCRRVTVYSKPIGGDWYRAYIDIDEISEGKWTSGHRIQTPVEKAEAPPAFVLDYLKQSGRFGDYPHGTVVVWENLDRADYRQREALRSKLVTDLGVIYRNFLVSTPMRVDNVNVEPCDPLFVTPGFRYYDLDADRAIAYPPVSVPVTSKVTKEVIGNMRVRFARMPATFFRVPEAKHTNRPGRKKELFNPRLEIADSNNGIIFCRNGRQIDVLRPPREIGSINATTDRFWAVEVDFDASLDELFSITTAKQQVRPDPAVWDMLVNRAKLLAAIGTIREDYKKDAGRVAEEAEKAKGTKNASVEAIESASRFRTTKPPADTPERQEEAERNLQQEAERRAKKSGLDPEKVRQELEAGESDAEHVVETEDLPGAPFYRCYQRGGGQRVLAINLAHPFYDQLYAGPGSTPRLRAALQVVLWALGEAEVDADPGSDRRLFYERDRASLWSPYIADALKELSKISIVEEPEDKDELATDPAA